MEPLELKGFGIQFKNWILGAVLVTCQVQFKEKGASMAQFALQVDGAAKESQQTFHDGQPQAGTPIFAVDLYGALFKALENMLLLVIGDADPTVPDLKVKFDLF